MRCLAYSLVVVLLASISPRPLAAQGPATSSSSPRPLAGEGSGVRAPSSSPSAASCKLAKDKIAPKAPDVLAYPPCDAVRFEGWIGREMDTCRRGRMFGQSIRDLVGPFAVREEDKMWRCEFWGKWFTSAVLAYRYQPDAPLRAVLDQAVGELISTQTPDGHLGTYKKAAELSNWDVWGRKYTLLGLLAYYEVTSDPAALKAATRLADYTMGQIGPGKADISTLGWWHGLAASSILEPTVLLYRQTGDQRYLDFAHYIVQSWQGPKGPDLVRKAIGGVTVFKMFPGPDPAKKGYMAGGESKAYEMMSCYEGLVELYRTTGNAECLEAAKKVFADILNTEITILGSGSSWERWCNGRVRQGQEVPEWMETCVTVTWMKFAAQLLRATGECSYADQIERATYNALLAAQREDGTWWCHYNPLEGQREPAPEHCKMHQNCCVANGPRGLNLLPALAFMSDKAGVVVNLYEKATAKCPVPGGAVKLAVKSSYPLPGPVEVSVVDASAQPFELALRIPVWSQANTVTLNGQPVAGVKPGQYLRLNRAWKAGDTIKLDFDFSTRLVKEPGGSGRVAVVRGPVVFAVEKRLVPSGLPAGEGNIVADAQGKIDARVPADKPSMPAKMVLDVPVDVAGKTVMLRMCDYASAGQTWSDASTLRVWLPQPIAPAQPLAGVPAAKARH